MTEAREPTAEEVRIAVEILERLEKERKAAEENKEADDFLDGSCPFSGSTDACESCQ